MKPRVLLDVDGVLADFVHAFRIALKKVTGKDEFPHVREDWDIVKAWDIEKHVADEVFAHLNAPGTALALPVLDGAKEGVAALQKVADVYIVTSPMQGMTWHREREMWLKAHFGISTKKIVHTAAKYVVAGDYLIDDRPSNLDKWEEHHPTGRGVLWATRFNQHAQHASPQRACVASWEHVLRVLDHRKRF